MKATGLRSPDAMERNVSFGGRYRAAMCLVITVVSFLGYWVENIFVAVTDHYIDNRNMMLPFLLGYGLGMAAVYVLFGTPTSPHFLKWHLPWTNRPLNLLYHFVLVFVCVSVGECLLGLFVEKFFDITWWDYSQIPLHVTKFTSVPTSLGFTVLIMGFIQFLFEPLLRVFSRLNPKVLYTLAIVFMVVMSIDFVVTGVRMYLTGNFVRIWRVEL